MSRLIGFVPWKEPNANQYLVTLAKQGRRLGLALGYNREDLSTVLVTKVAPGGVVEATVRAGGSSIMERNTHDGHLVAEKINSV